MREITESDLDDLVVAARASARRRLNLNLHQALDDPVNRLAIAIEPDSYIRPHRHDRPETVVLLRGAIDVLAFDDEGVLLSRRRLDGGGGAIRIVEYPPHTWHSLLALASPTVFFEVKQGPYAPLAPGDSAGWAPAEGTPEVADWMRFAGNAKPGDRFAVGLDGRRPAAGCG
ncbi:MAG TPA: WbuC family cupin fold metalloprotein [Burkholderiaceae bacterium]|nr:WbuC family cupin fold metalloprotein [Burkholderiaceae bacterium]